MSRAYEQKPGTKEEKPYLCPGKIFAGNPKLVITINDNSHTIYFTLREQARHCGVFCDAKTQCTMGHKKAIINAFSPQPQEEKTLSIGMGPQRNKGVLEVNGVIIEDDKENPKVRTD